MAGFDEAFPPEAENEAFKGKSFDELFPVEVERERYRRQTLGTSPIQDLIFGGVEVNPIARVLDHFGQGAKQGWGAEPTGLSKESEDALKKAGIFNDYDKGQRSIIKAANESLFRGAATYMVEPIMRGLPAALRGTQEAIAQIGVEAGQPKVGREAAAMFEAFPAGFRQATGAPGVGVAEMGRAQHIATVESEVARARDAGVIGAGEGGWKGTAEVTAPTPKAEAEAVKQDMPVEVKPVDPTAAPAVEAPVAAPVEAVGRVVDEAHPIAQQVMQKLYDAGRPVEEASASGQLIANYYETRAARFEGALGTADELYAREGAQVKGAARQFELAQERPAGLDLGKELNQVAYHGSPYDFDVFDTGKIGTGEGAQAYGHGLYFAESQGVAREYQKGVIDKKWYDETNARLSQLAREMDAEKVPGSYDKFKTQKGRDLKTEYDRLLSERAEKKGNLYRVNIRPEPHEFLAWDKPLNEQPVAVREKLQPLINAKLKELQQQRGASEPLADPTNHLTPEAYLQTGALKAEGFYRMLGDDLQKSDATRALADAGIPGIRYLDQGSRALGEGTHNYVVFDPKNIEITDKNGKPVPRKEFELDQVKRGKIRFKEDAKPVITLFKDANESTFIHETGHQWLEDLMKDSSHPKAPDILKADGEAVLKWLGVEKASDIKTKQHEQFARGFERYMMEGKAPTQGLAKVFEQFKNWLTKIYQTVERLKSPVNDEIRGVFDRLIALKPEQVKIEPEGPTKSFADIHEADAISAAHENARPVAQTIQAERDRVAAEHLPEGHDARLENIASGTSRREAGGAQPLRDGNEARLDAGKAGNDQASGTVSPSGSDLAPESLGSSPKTDPVTPQDPFIRETPLVDKAGNIRLENLSTPADVNQVIRDAAVANNDFIDARRGVVTDGQVLELADALGMDEGMINRRKLGEAFNAEQIMAARKLLIQSATTVRDAMVKAATGDEAAIMAYAETKARHRMIQEQVAGLTAEAGRALRAFRKLEGQEEAVKIGDFLKDTTGKTLFQLQREAQLGLQLDTPAQVSKFVNDTTKPKLSDMLIEAWMSALLSGPKTHVANILGNTITGIIRPVETAMAAGIGKARNLVTGTQDRVLPREAAAELFGAVQGAREGVVAAYKAYQTGEGQLTSASQVEKHNPRAIPSATVNLFGKEREIGGKQARIPLRLLAAEDEFFKSVSFRGDINRQAYATAAKEGLPAEQMHARVAELAANPTDAMIEAAKKVAEYQTFQTPLGKFGRSLQAISNAHPLLKVVLPFIRTPLNLLKYANERTPLGLFSREVRDNLSGKNGAVARDTQAARIAMGTMVGVAAYEMASQGLITGGGPADAKEKAIKKADGWQEYSVKIGDHYYSYRRLDPFSTILGVVSDAYELSQKMSASDAEKHNIPALVMGAISKTLLDKASLKGTSDLIQAATQWERFGDGYVRNLVGTVVPAISAQTAQNLDPVVREARTVLDNLRARTPGLSMSLMPKRDVWGEPMTREGGVGPDIASPIIESKLKNDPVNKALLDAHYYPSKVERKIRGVELNEQQYDDYARIAGRTAKVRLNAIVGMPGFSQMPEVTRKELMTNTITNSREMARSIIMMQNPEIMKKATDAKLKGLKQ